jgi:hypothetical protein
MIVAPNNAAPALEELSDNGSCLLAMVGISAPLAVKVDCPTARAVIVLEVFKEDAEVSGSARGNRETDVGVAISLIARIVRAGVAVVVGTVQRVNGLRVTANMPTASGGSASAEFNV